MGQQISDNELKLVDVVTGLFKSLYTGNEKSIKTDRILFELSKLSHAVNGNTLRAVIGHIRRNDLLAPGYIVSNVNYGYWLSYDEVEMREFLDKQMNRMANQFHNVKHLKQRLTKSQKNLQDVQVQMFA